MGANPKLKLMLSFEGTTAMSLKVSPIFAARSYEEHGAARKTIAA
jgi:hypothetical protein